MLSVVTIGPHSSSPMHFHPNEQWGVCLEGEWIRIQLDILALLREEYSQAGQGYGAASLGGVTVSSGRRSESATSEPLAYFASIRFR